MKYNYKIESKTNKYNGFFKIDKYSIKHSLFGGGESNEVLRELFERGNAAAVLPYDPVLDQVVLIEQFRIGALQSTHSPWQLEVIAGVLDKDDESPETVVIREAVEEANCEIIDPIKICEYFCSPGGSSEKIFLYRAKVDSTDLGGVYGLAEEAEDIKVHVVKFEDALEMVNDGRIETAMTIIAMQWLAINRDGLRKK